MNRDDGLIREALAVRAARSDPTSVTAQLRDVTTEPQDSSYGTFLGRIRSPLGAIATTAVTVAVAVAIAAFAIKGPSTGAAQPPLGLFQAEEPVGLGAVGSETCVTVQLDDEAYRSGAATVWWWTIGDKGCRTSSSGPMATSAQLVAVDLRGPAGLASRTGYRIAFTLQLLPSGSEDVVFTLDPGQGPSGSDHIAAFGGADVIATTNAFDRVEKLDVTEPGGPNIPTPSTE
jgi:hypothetical protein